MSAHEKKLGSDYSDPSRFYFPPTSPSNPSPTPPDEKVLPQMMKIVGKPDEKEKKKNKYKVSMSITEDGILHPYDVLKTESKKEEGRHSPLRSEIDRINGAVTAHCSWLCPPKEHLSQDFGMSLGFETEIF